MVRVRRKRVKNPNKVYSFRRELVQLYRKFRADVEVLCKKHKVAINHWYSPSTIFQPKFIIDSIGFTADELFSDKELKMPIDETRKRKMKR